MSDDELAMKFRHNASRVLTSEATERVIGMTLDMESVKDICELMKLL